MEKFEYTTVEAEDHNMMAILKERGERGWRLHSIFQLTQMSAWGVEEKISTKKLVLMRKKSILSWIAQLL